MHYILLRLMFLHVHITNRLASGDPTTEDAFPASHVVHVRALMVLEYDPAWQIGQRFGCECQLSLVITMALVPGLHNGGDIYEVPSVEHLPGDEYRLLYIYSG